MSTFHCNFSVSFSLLIPLYFFHSFRVSFLLSLSFFTSVFFLSFQSYFLSSHLSFQISFILFPTFFLTFSFLPSLILSSKKIRSIVSVFFFITNNLFGFLLASLSSFFKFLFVSTKKRGRDYSRCVTLCR